MYKFTIIGSGKMADALGYFLKQEGEVLFFDPYDVKNEGRLNRKYNAWKMEDSDDWLVDPDCIISAAPASTNVFYAEQAAIAGAPFVDLGGVQEIVEKQKTIRSSVPTIPHCGLAPGLVPMLAYQMFNKFYDDSPTKIEMYCGGISANRYLPLGWIPTWSIDGLVNEYTKASESIIWGNKERCSSLLEQERVVFENVTYKAFYIMEFEAALTHGGIGNLFDLLGNNKNVYARYKTLRWPGHYGFINQLGDLKRDWVKEILSELVQVNTEFPDMVVVMIKVKNKNNEYVFKQIWDSTNELTAMQRVTAASAASIAVLVANELINCKGFFPVEFTPIDKFLKQMNKFNVPVNFNF